MKLKCSIIPGNLYKIFLVDESIVNGVVILINSETNNLCIDTKYEELNDNEFVFIDLDTISEVLVGDNVSSDKDYNSVLEDIFINSFGYGDDYSEEFRFMLGEYLVKSFFEEIKERNVIHKEIKIDNIYSFLVKNKWHKGRVSKIYKDSSNNSIYIRINIRYLESNDEYLDIDDNNIKEYRLETYIKKEEVELEKFMNSMIQIKIPRI